MAGKEDSTVSSIIVTGDAGRVAISAGIRGITTVVVHDNVAVRKLV
jgi:hypothetical protein